MYVLGQYKFKCFAYPSFYRVSHSIEICTVAIKNTEICTLFQSVKL